MRTGRAARRAARASCVVVLALACLGLAHAGVVLGNTRVVFPGDARDVTVRLDNRNAHPVLVQAWIERADGDDRAVPLAPLPPLFRMEPGRGQALRIHRLPGALPRDRETLFWLNVLDMPPEPSGATASPHMKIALRTQVKLFHRPAGLAGSAASAPRALRWRLVRMGAADAVEVDNPTPYHVTIARLVLGDGLDTHGEMVAPFDRRVIALDAPAIAGDRQAPSAASRARRLREAGRVVFDAINDQGGTERVEGALAESPMSPGSPGGTH